MIISVCPIIIMITAVPQKPQPEEYHTIYTKLQTFVDSIDTKLMSKIQSIQHSFADQYKQAVRIMNQQLQEIRTRLDAAALKQKANERLKVLEEERNCFRQMSKDLDMKLKDEVKINKQLRQQIRVLQDELENYKSICFKLELEMTKSRREVAEMYRSKSVNKERKEKTNLEPKQSMKQLYKSKQTLPDPNLTMKRSFSSTLYRTEKVRLEPKVNIIKSTFQFQEILTNCIKAIKKEIFYRTGSTISIAYGRFMEDQTAIPFQKLTLTDKKQLVKMFMEDPNVLQKFYTFLFKKDPGSEEKPIKPFDSKFNHSNLLMIKRKFQDRLATTKLASLKKI